LVGLTTSLAALWGYERPGGFAIPVDDDFRRALDTLKTGRLPDYGFLGVSPGYLTSDERRRGHFGARVEEVVPATPAAAAGLRTGDVITHVAGEAIHDDLELIRRISGLHADATVPLLVLRGGDATRPGRPLTIEVKLSKKRFAGGRESIAETPSPTWRGLRVDYATSAPLFREQSRDLDPEGCVGVIEVQRDSLAWKAGLRPGDFISHADGSRVTTPSQFHAAVAPLEADVTLRLTAVASDNATRTVRAP
jgi:serine protease Do